MGRIPVSSSRGSLASNDYDNCYQLIVEYYRSFDLSRGVGRNRCDEEGWISKLFEIVDL